MGKLVQSFSHLRKFFGRQPAGSSPKALGPGSSQISYQADRKPWSLLQKGMLNPRRNEKDGSGGNRVKRLTDALPAPAPQVNKKLPVGMTMRALGIKGLQMPVQPESMDDPIAAAEMKALKQDRPKWCAFLRSRDLF
jgi:hypothetical protein